MHLVVTSSRVHRSLYLAIMRITLYFQRQFLWAKLLNTSVYYSLARTRGFNNQSRVYINVLDYVTMTAVHVLYVE